MDTRDIRTSRARTLWSLRALSRLRLLRSALLLPGVFQGCLLTIAVMQGCIHTPTKLSVESPSFSRDGESIVFEGICAGSSDLYRVSYDGTHLQKLSVPFAKYVSNPVYSPDGRKIAFAAGMQLDASPDLCVMDVDGTNPRCLTANGRGGFHPVFSPDGGTIYFVSSTSPRNNSGGTDSVWPVYDIYAVNFDGSNRKKLTELGDFRIRSLSVSPDGRNLLFYRASFNQSPPASDSIWVYPLGVPNEMHSLRPDICKYVNKIGQGRACGERVKYDTFYSPQYSPRGDSILFVWPGQDQGHFGHEIYIMDTESLKAQKVTDLHAYITHPSFSFDGKRIVFIVGTQYKKGRPTQFELWTINTDGSNPRRIDFGNEGYCTGR